MRFDHLTFAAGPDGLAATSEKIGLALGAQFLDGGVHPRFGTRNRILPLKHGHYLEIVEALDHPASDKAAFGQAVRERSERGGGWLHWCVAVDDIAEAERRIGRHAVPGNRHRPDGYNLEWVQIGTSSVRSDPQLPYVTQWNIPEAEHPSNAGPAEIALTALQIAGAPDSVEEWLGEHAIKAIGEIRVDWIAPNGLPGILSATFSTPEGDVSI